MDKKSALVMVGTILVGAFCVNAAIVKGVVQDSATSVALSGVSVQLKGTTTAATTDAQGKFSLNVTTGINGHYLMNGSMSAWFFDQARRTITGSPAGTIKIYSLRGELRQDQQLQKSYVVPHLADGMYIMEITGHDGNQVYKVVMAGEFVAVSAISGNSEMTLAKAAASGDTLVANRYGYIGKQPPVTAGDTNVVIKMTAMTHGEQLATWMTGPGGLGVSTSQLRNTVVNGARVGTWPSDFHPWSSGGWIPNAQYVYNNDPNNHGGYVPTGGMTIDGYAIPAGVWIAQFNNFDESIIITGDCAGATAAFPGIVFRGCRWRGTNSAPGYLNVYASSHTIVWFFYCDAGGLGAADAQYNEIPVQITDGTTALYMTRTYFSYTSTGVNLTGTQGDFVENYFEKLTCFYCPGAPPGETSSKHLNGIQWMGNVPCTRVLRNCLILQSPDGAGRIIGQTDALMLGSAIDSRPGTGTNPDGTTGYQIKDNYLGGGGYTVYLGSDAGIKNMVFSGNHFTTKWWQNGGSYGQAAYVPTWGTNSNVQSDNIWADDYGSYNGGTAGNTPLSQRQYPAGNGPRKGTSVF